MTDGRAAVLSYRYICYVVYFYFIKHTNTNMGIIYLCVCVWVSGCVACTSYYEYSSAYFILRSSVIIIIIRLYIYVYCSIAVHNTTIISDSPVLHRTKPGLLACIYVYIHAKRNTTERGSLFVLVFYSILMSLTVYNRMYRVLLTSIFKFIT